jgi:N-acetylneuraminate synthase/N,N'-diacetyllegionaminate synthase
MLIIAEIGQNHNGDMGLAREMIKIAADSGADVAKFQLYDAKALFPRQGNPWFDYNCRTELSRDQLELLAGQCRESGIEFMSSVFDAERVAWLEDVGVKRYKVASRSIRDQALLQALIATGKPLIVSLGHWNKPCFPIIDTPVKVDFLYCISKYPTAFEDVKLSTVDFTRYAGFSDHTLGLTAPMAALARGARIIEKHFTLDKNMEGPDHSCSADPQELRALCRFRDELLRCW